MIDLFYFLFFVELVVKLVVNVCLVKVKFEYLVNCCVMIVWWLCKMYGWFGLWGVVMGLIFGVLGIWLNYCVVLKLFVV